MNYEMFTRFSLPYLKQIAKGVKEGLKSQNLDTVPMVSSSLVHQKCFCNRKYVWFGFNHFFCFTCTCLGHFRKGLVFWTGRAVFGGLRCNEY